MRWWWLKEAVNGLVRPFARPDPEVSQEERNTISAITGIALVIFVILMVFGEWAFSLQDDLDIYVGILFLLSVVSAFLLARLVFVWTCPTLSATADENAKKRYPADPPT